MIALILGLLGVPVRVLNVPGTSTPVWKGMIGRNRLSDLNLSSILLLDFSLSLTNTKFKHKGVHKCAWNQNVLAQRSHPTRIHVSFTEVLSSQQITAWSGVGSTGRRGVEGNRETWWTKVGLKHLVKFSIRVVLNIQLRDSYSDLQVFDACCNSNSQPKCGWWM